MALLIFVVGCEGGSALDAGLDGADGGAADAGGCVPDPLACEDLTPDPTCSANWVVGLRGDLTDLDGTPIVGGRPQLCARVAPDDRLVCLLPPMSRGDGSFTIEVDPAIRCINSGALRVLAPGQDFAATYCAIDLTGSAPIAELSPPFELAPVSPATLPARGDDATVREVPFSGGMTLTLSPDQLFGDSYDDLAGARVAPSDVPCSPMSFDGAYAFNPETRVEGGAAARWSNDDALPPGTVVDVYLVGGLEAALLDGTPVEEADWVVFGTATVRPDGAFIETDAGSELPYLSWIAWKAR